MQKDLQIPSESDLIIYLEQVLSGNNEKIKNATQFMRVFRKTKESLSMFLKLIQQHQSPQIRQLAAVLCKKNICDIYENKLQQDEQNQVKSILLNLFFNEQVKVVKKAIGTLIGFVASIALENNNWPQLLQQISQSTGDEQSLESKKAGLELLAFVLDTSGDFLGAYYDNFLVFFKQIITNPNQEIQKETLRCLNYLFSQNNFTKDQEIQYQQLVEQWLRVFDFCVQKEDEDLVSQTFETISMIIEQKAKLLNPYLQEILKYILGDKVLLNKNLTDNIKEMSLDVIYSMADYKKSIITKNADLMNLLITTMFQLVTQSKKGSEDEQTIQDSALAMIETLSITLPKKKVYKLLKTNIYILINHQNEEHQYSGFLILSRIVEGCADLLRTDLSQIMQLIPKGLQSQHSLIKGVTIFTISNMAEFLNPDVFNYHQLLLPALLNHLNDDDQLVVKQAMASIDLFCEYLEDKVVQYIPAIIPKLCEVINKQNNQFQSKQIAVSAFGSLAISCQQKLLPYLDTIFQVLNQIIYLQMTPQNTQVVSESFQSLGKISSNVFKNDTNLYQKYIHSNVEHIYNIMINSQDPQVRESSLCFFYEIAVTLGENFQIYTDKLVKFALHLANQNEENEVVKPKKEEFALDSDDEEENFAGNFKMAFVYEKIAAICALGNFAQATPKHFFPYFQQTIEMLNNQFGSQLTDIRVEVIICFKNLAESLVKYFHNNQLPTFSKGLPSQNNYNNDLKNFIQIDLINKIFFNLEEDMSSDVVSNTLDALQLLIKALGPVIIENHLERLTKIILILLDGEGKCQIPIDEEEEDEQETDVKVWESLTDLIPVMAKYLKQQFIPIFQKIIISLMKYSSEEKDINDNIQLVGLLGECFKYVPDLIEMFHDKLVPWLINTQEQKDEGLIRNAIFCLGVMVDKKPQLMAQHQRQVFFYIEKSYEKIQNPEVRDNIISCLIKIIIHDNQIPLDQIVEKIMIQVPFKGDQDEVKTSVRFVFYLLNRDGQIADKYFDKLAQVLVDALANKKDCNLKDRFVNEIVQNIKKLVALQQVYKQKIEEQIMRLQSEQQKQVISQLE